LLSQLDEDQIFRIDHYLGKVSELSLPFRLFPILCIDILSFSRPVIPFLSFSLRLLRKWSRI
jgi:hypothetical protein